MPSASAEGSHTRTSKMGNEEWLSGIAAVFKADRLTASSKMCSKDSLNSASQATNTIGKVVKFTVRYSPNCTGNTYLWQR